jgi:hypothetical protein
MIKYEKSLTKKMGKKFFLFIENILNFSRISQKFLFQPFEIFTELFFLHFAGDCSKDISQLVELFMTKTFLSKRQAKLKIEELNLH